MMPTAVTPAMAVMAPILLDEYPSRSICRLPIARLKLNPNVMFWTGAFANMLVIVILMAVAVRSVRAGNVARHKRAMLTAMALVVAFLVAYPVKVVILGREDLSVWSTAAVRTLYFHETCVVVMLIAGIFALTRAWRLRNTRAVTRSAEDPPAPETTLRWHRRAGWVGVVGAVLGLLSAGFVLAGMYARL